MRVCPYCAEEIQDSAIVCKHCHRDLTAVKPTSRAAWMALGMLIFLVLIFVNSQVFKDGDLEAFKAKRAEWHLKCDQYLKTPLTNPKAAECNEELNALMAYAKQRGWMNVP
jgi:hypothetical protein